VQVGRKLLVFDYLSERGTPAAEPGAGGLDDGTIEPDNLEGLEVYPVPRSAPSGGRSPRSGV
jgi:hypothetical protein